MATVRTRLRRRRAAQQTRKRIIRQRSASLTKKRAVPQIKQKEPVTEVTHIKIRDQIDRGKDPLLFILLSHVITREPLGMLTDAHA